MPRIASHIAWTALVLVQFTRTDAHAQGLSLSLGVAAERTISGDFVHPLGPSFRMTLGGRWTNDLAVNAGIHYWRHGPSGHRFVLLSFLAGASQTLGPRSRAWRPVIGGRVEWGLYDRVPDGGEPYGAGELGLELGLEHRLGGKGALQVLVLPSYLTLVEGPAGLVLGLGLRVTPRSPD